jgi:hypothetical protein
VAATELTPQAMHAWGRVNARLWGKEGVLKREEEKTKKKDETAFPPLPL